jgi:hypothetical protein
MSPISEIGVKEQPMPTTKSGIEEWRKNAFDAFETHTFEGKPGEDRYCKRCNYTLDKFWKQPNMGVPSRCEDVQQYLKHALKRPQLAKSGSKVSSFGPK